MAAAALSAAPSRSQPRYREWAEQLVKAGYAVLLPDSYGSRELGPQCRVKERKVQARRERVEDIMAARQWLVQQAWVARDRISLIGWANGASALLWAVRPQLPRAATSRISARRSRSIRIAASPQAPAGARGSRRCS